MIRVYAPAKINLVLEVLGKRDDGYHEMRSLVQTVSLYDELTIDEADNITVNCFNQEQQIQDNLVLKAAERLREATGCNMGAKILLKKNIPVSAGLGGGSSDAAAALAVLNYLWKLNLPAADLIGLAAELGSDVPLFMDQGTVLIEGRGEKVTRLHSHERLWFVLLVPDMPESKNKTQRLYGLLHKRHYTNGDRISVAVKQWETEDRIASSHLFNIFDEVAFQAFTGLEKYRHLFQQAGASNIHLTGSGPTLFSMVDDERIAKEIRQRLIIQGLKAYEVATTGTGNPTVN